MEVKINKEIRNYTESMFFGLSLRQFIFSVLACGVAVGLYFLLRPHFGTETLSWMCILGAAPFALIGFVKYNGMTAEQFLWAWIKSEFLMPKRLLFSPDNLYYEALKETIQDHEREAMGIRKKRKAQTKKSKKQGEMYALSDFLIMVLSWLVKQSLRAFSFQEAIVIKDMSRLGRDYLKVGQVMEILRQRGVRLIAINDGVDSLKGIFTTVSQLPRQEPRKATVSASAAV